MDTAADLDLLFADRGVDATVGGVTFPVLFYEPGKEVNMFNGAMETTAPACTARSSDVAARGIIYGTSITINAIVYTVIDRDPSGTGLTLLTLGT